MPTTILRRSLHDYLGNTTSSPLNFALQSIFRCLTPYTLRVHSVCLEYLNVFEQSGTLHLSPRLGLCGNTVTTEHVKNLMRHGRLYIRCLSFGDAPNIDLKELSDFILEECSVMNYPFLEEVRVSAEWPTQRVFSFFATMLREGPAKRISKLVRANICLQFARLCRDRVIVIQNNSNASSSSSLLQSTVLDILQNCILERNLLIFTSSSKAIDEEGKKTNSNNNNNSIDTNINNETFILFAAACQAIAFWWDCAHRVPARATAAWQLRTPPNATYQELFGEEISTSVAEKCLQDVLLPFSGSLNLIFCADPIVYRSAVSLLFSMLRVFEKNSACYKEVDRVLFSVSNDNKESRKMFEELVFRLIEIGGRCIPPISTAAQSSDDDDDDDDDSGSNNFVQRFNKKEEEIFNEQTRSVWNSQGERFIREQLNSTLTHVLGCLAALSQRYIDSVAETETEKISIPTMFGKFELVNQQQQRNQQEETPEENIFGVFARHLNTTRVKKAQLYNWSHLSLSVFSQNIAILYIGRWMSVFEAQLKRQKHLREQQSPETVTTKMIMQNFTFHPTFSKYFNFYFHTMLNLFQSLKTRSVNVDDEESTLQTFSEFLGSYYVLFNMLFDEKPTGEGTNINNNEKFLSSFDFRKRFVTEFPILLKIAVEMYLMIILNEMEEEENSSATTVEADVDPVASAAVPSSPILAKRMILDNPYFGFGSGGNKRITKNFFVLFFTAKIVDESTFEMRKPSVDEVMKEIVEMNFLDLEKEGISETNFRKKLAEDF